MVEQLSKELPVAIGVYISSDSGRYSIRAAHFYEPTLLFDPLYSKSVVEFGTQAHGQFSARARKNPRWLSEAKPAVNCA